MEIRLVMRLERDRGFRVRRWGVSVPCCIFPLSFFLDGGGEHTEVVVAF